MRRVQTVKAWRNCPPVALGSASSVPRGLWGYRVSAVLPRSGGARKRPPRCATVLRTTTEVFDEFLRKARSCRDDLEPRWGRSVPVWHDGHDQGAQGSRGFLSAYGAERGGGASTLRRLHDAAGAIVERDDHDDDRTGQRGSPDLSSRVGPGLLLKGWAWFSAQTSAPGIGLARGARWGSRLALLLRAADDLRRGVGQTAGRRTHSDPRGPCSPALPLCSSD